MTFVPTRQRPVRDSADPTISVVLAVSGDAPKLAEALSALAARHGRDAVEVAVAHAGPLQDSDARDAHPHAVFVELPANTPTPQLRRAGLTAVDGDIVAFTRSLDLDWTLWLDELTARRTGLTGPPIGGSASSTHPRTTT